MSTPSTPAPVAPSDSAAPPDIQSTIPGAKSDCALDNPPPPFSLSPSDLSRQSFRATAQGERPGLPAVALAEAGVRGNGPQPSEAVDSLSLPLAPRRLKGKIPSLPKTQRDAINNWLLDGATYAVVIQRMAEQGVELNGENLSNWYQTGFQNFLAHLERADYQRARYEAATDLLQDTDVSKLPQAGLQTAAAQIYDLLGQFTAGSVAKNLADDPDKYTRIVNSLSRLARETLALQKYQDACARARAALQPLRDPKRQLSEEERRSIVRDVDSILGVPSIDEDDPVGSSSSSFSSSPSPDLDHKATAA